MNLRECARSRDRSPAAPLLLLHAAGDGRCDGGTLRTRRYTRRPPPAPTLPPPLPLSMSSMWASSPTLTWASSLRRRRPIATRPTLPVRRRPSRSTTARQAPLCDPCAKRARMLGLPLDVLYGYLLASLAPGQPTCGCRWQPSCNAWQACTPHTQMAAAGSGCDDWRGRGSRLWLWRVQGVAASIVAARGRCGVH